jgi:Fuc2NAc and GlcNAc transferase
VLIQAPNERSSHVSHTPSGGGFGIVVAIMLVAFITLPLLRLDGYLSILGVLLLALPLALFGLWDDMIGISIIIRLLVQCAVFVVLVTFFESALLLQWCQSHHWPNSLLWLIFVLVIFSGIWWVNLYNFMDGIDGLAVSQGIFILLAGSALAYFSWSNVLDQAWWWLSLGLVGALCGFTYWNWSPAKIFMGDVGSTWLAFLIFAIILCSLSANILPVAAWLILVAVFVVDASVTLTVRLLRGQKIFSAHRSHVYQKLTRHFPLRTIGHRRVTCFYMLVNVVWLFPLALLVIQFKNYWPLCLCAAYIPLIITALLLGAGRKQQG